MKLHKRQLVLAGGTAIFIIAGGLIFCSLLIGGLLLAFAPDQTDTAAQRRLGLQSFNLIAYPTATAVPQPVNHGPTEAVASAVDQPQANVDNPDPTVRPTDEPRPAALTVQPIATQARTTGAAVAMAATAPNFSPPASPLSTPGPTPAPLLAAATSTVVKTATTAPTKTTTAGPTPTETSTASATSTATATATASPTSTPALGQIDGRALVDGAPASGVTLHLEDQAFNLVAQTTAAADGSYTFSDLAASSEGYVVVFAQEWNTQYDTNQVISWGWLGPVPLAEGATVQLPDLDLSLQGFGQTSPPPNASYSAAAVSSGSPIEFEWAGYPQATVYWLDLTKEGNTTPVWADSTTTMSLSFDGTLTNGGPIKPGEYWWGVGAQRQLGTYSLVVYGYLPVLVIEP